MIGEHDFRTMVELVDRMRFAEPDHRLFLVDARGAETVFTWRELHRKMTRHAVWLQAQGIEPGDRVVLCPTNNPDVLSSFLALFYLGAVPLSVSGTQMGQATGSQLPFIADLLVRTGAKGVFNQSELVGGNDEVGLIPPNLILDHVPSSLTLDDVPPALAPARVDQDEVAFVQFSSGSTSRPKGVKITHRNVLNNVKLIVSAGGRSADEACISWLPLYHDMGLIGGFISGLWHCLRVLKIQSPIRFLMKPISWLETMSATGARITVCPNFALDVCADRISDEDVEARRIDLSRLEVMFVGAEPVRPASLERFQAKFRRFGLGEQVFSPVYGLAEATLIVTAPTYRAPVKQRQIGGVQITSVGQPIGDFQVRVVGDDGRDLPDGEIGELWLKGTSVTTGYLDEEANLELFSAGWLRTGDLGLRDEDGSYYITGRLKDLIIINGKNYYAHDIVAELEDLPFFERGKVAVFSLETDGREQMIVMTVPVGRMTPTVRAKIAAFQAFMKLGGPRGWLKGIAVGELESYVEKLISSDRTELTNEIKRYILARFGVPAHDVVFVPRIPRTTSGKLKRDSCEQLYREQVNSGREES